MGSMMAVVLFVFIGMTIIIKSGAQHVMCAAGVHAPGIAPGERALQSLGSSCTGLLPDCKR
jgi:hypothetical protein